MIRMPLQQAAHILGLETSAEFEFTGVSTDSREPSEGMLFAALPGDRADGHDYAAQAVENGACAVLCSRALDLAVPQLVVADVRSALGRLAGAWRAQMDIRVAAITGSNGKTTTKELLASILGMEDEVLATQGNYNNELGLPLTLFRLETRHRFAVLELGASQAGDIRYLAGIAKPDVGLVTNVGPAHLKGFGDVEGVARAKGEIYSSLPAEGFAVINRDESWAPLWQELSTAGNQLTFGLAETADIRGLPGDGRHQVITPAGAFTVQLRLPGEHNLMNALAATAAATALDVPNDQIKTGLEAARPVPGRLNIIRCEAGWTVIDDTYNANPASLYAALQVLAREPGEPWLVLGDMKELGPDSHKLHAEMGEAAASLGVRRLFAIGEVSEATARAFGPGAEHFTDHETLTAALLSALHPGVACLVKGSRSMAMERIVRGVSGKSANRLREAG